MSDPTDAAPGDDKAGTDEPGVAGRHDPGRAGERTPFSAAEQAEIAAQLTAIKDALPQADINTEQLAQLEARLDEADEASRRLGRKDWPLLFAGLVTTLIVVGTISPAQAASLLRVSRVVIVVTGVVLAVVGVVIASIALRRARQRQMPPDPDAPLRRRVHEISNALSYSANSLGLAISLIADLQSELSSRAAVLESLRQQISDKEELARVTDEASQTLDKPIKAGLRDQERRMRRTGWQQGLVYAILGAVIALGLVEFGHLLPIIK